MKINIEYNFGDADDKRLLDLCRFSQKYNNAMFDIAHNLKIKVELEMGEDFDEDTFFATTKKIWDIIESNGLTQETIEYHANG